MALLYGDNDEDLKSVAGPPAHEINHTSYTGANSDIGAFKEGYLCDHEEFNCETSCYRFSTQPEHAANWFHTKRSNGLWDMSFISQAIYTSSKLILFKESNSATQTHVQKPRDHSLHRRPLGYLLVFKQQNLVATELFNQLSARNADDYLVNLKSK